MKKVYEDAIVEYKKLVKNDPNNAQGYFNLSTAYNGLNEGRKSILCARKAMDLYEKKKDGPSAAKTRVSPTNSIISALRSLVNCFAKS